MGDPVSLALRKTVVLRAFLGHVPECSGKWDRASCGLLGRGSATTLGLSPFPFLLCPFIESPTLTFLAVVTPLAFSLRGVPVGQAPRPLLPCPPAWIGCGPAACVASPNRKLAQSRPEAQPPGFLPPVPAVQSGQRRFSGPLAVGLSLLESAAESWEEGGTELAFCMSDGNVWEGEGTFVPGTEPQQQVFMTLSPRADAMRLGGHVHGSPLWAAVARGWLRVGFWRLALSFV